MTGVHRIGFLVPLIGFAVGVGNVQRASGAGTEESAQQAFREGVEAARQSRWPEARSLFEQAYALSPRPVVLINLAGAQARTGHLTDAAKNYRRILDDAASVETAPFRKAAAEVLPELEQRIPRIRVRPSGHAETDSFQIDGDDIPLADLTLELPLDPGQHVLVVNRAGIERARVLFSLAERERREIPLALPRVGLFPVPVLGPAGAAGNDSAPGVDLATRPGPEAADSNRRWWASPWTWTVVGVVVVAATSATLFYVYEQREKPFEGNLPPGKITVR